ncbi:helix-turn-helix domain-containing protein [Devosia sp.]|uniref:winged helix-turn-helix transcriptional regulator n=1 Tax=Devosia sp. TaxID=1871048 RepID=UPI001ACFA249|nr:helix-turn-helix domain-containing protein [Devosia sp.]MBN9336044.1 helix-turn-helix transcriptional regulator [Devosia sp.]
MNQVSSIESDEEDVHYLCRRTFVLTIKDALNVVSGKWKLAIVCTLLSGPKGFAEIERLLGTISPRMLTRELRELEVNGVILRQTDPTQATKAQKYALTPSGQGLEQVITMMANWGLEHRKLSGNTSTL